MKDIPVAVLITIIAVSVICLVGYQYETACKEAASKNYVLEACK